MVDIVMGYEPLTTGIFAHVEYEHVMSGKAMATLEKVMLDLEFPAFAFMS